MGPSTSAASTTADGDGTAARILDVAERLVQQHGYNAFSYADIAAELGVTKASLHYHFATKADLGVALITRYAARFAAALAAIDAAETDPCAKLRRYVELYAGVLDAGRMCLCGMLAADYTTLAEPMRDAVRRFFDDNERWLSGVLDAGRGCGELRFDAAPGAAAQLIVSTLEGAMLVARSRGDVAQFRSAAAMLLGSVGVPSGTAGGATPQG